MRVPSQSGWQGLLPARFPPPAWGHSVLLPPPPPAPPTSSARRAPASPGDARGMDGVLGVGNLSPFPGLPPNIEPPSFPNFSAGSFLERGRNNTRQSASLAGPPLLLGGPGREKLLPITRGAGRGAFPCAGTGRALPASSLLASGCCLNHGFSILCQPLRVPSPGLCPLPPSQAGRVTSCSRPNSGSRLVKGVGASHGAELGSGIAVCKARPCCDRARGCLGNLILLVPGLHGEKSGAAATRGPVAVPKRVLD